MKYSFNNLLGLSLLVAVVSLLAGCETAPKTVQTADNDPAFAGGLVFHESYDTVATVESVAGDTRRIVLTFEDGTSTTNIAGPEVINFDKIKAGDRVKAHIGLEYGVFLIKNGLPPVAASAVLFAGAPKGANPAGIMTMTHDLSAQVEQVDRSSLRLTLKFPNGHIKTFKVEPPFTLERVEAGDNVVLRATETVAMRLDPAKD